jgi:predicted PurR-regulated permease PerM
VISLNVNAATRIGINALLLLGAVFALYLGQTIVIPLVIAVLLAAMLYPSAVWLHQKARIPWSIACMTVITGLILVCCLIMFGVVAAVPKILNALPRSSGVGGETQQVYEALRTRLNNLFPLDENLFPEKARDSQPFAYLTDTITKFVPEALMKLGYYGLSWVWFGILILFILLFLMIEGRMLVKRVEEIFGPSSETRAKVGKVLADVANQIRTYLVWRTVLNFAFAGFVGLVYQWAGLSQPWTWAMLTAILFYIPYLGPIVAGIPPVVDAFLSRETPVLALGILIFYLVLAILEGYLVVPVVMGRSMEMNATTVMLACLFWELVWGAVGLFLAMPMMAALKSICYYVPGWRPWANLMGTEDSDAAPLVEVAMPPPKSSIGAPPSAPSSPEVAAPAEVKSA